MNLSQKGKKESSELDGGRELNGKGKGEENRKAGSGMGRDEREGKRTRRMNGNMQLLGVGLG